VAYDQDDRLVVCNEAYRTIYSASAPAMKPGTTFAEIIRFGLEREQYPEAGTSDAERSAWLERRLAQHALNSTDVVQQLSNGRWVQIRERRTANGYRVGFRADITEVKQEAARLRAIIDNFPGGISLFDADLKLVACNDEFRKLLNLPVELFEDGLPTLEAILRSNAGRGEFGPGEVDGQVRQRLELARMNEPHVLERVRPNGAALEIRGIPVPGGGFISTYVDITEVYQVARRLADSEQNARMKSETLQITLAHMSQGLSMFDEHDRLIVWNDRFAEIYRLPPSLLCSGTPSRAISAHLRDIDVFETDQPQWRKIIASGQGLTAKLRSRYGRTIKVVYIPVSGSGWVATHEEVTNQILVQTKLAQQKEQLAQINMRLDAALESMSQGLCLLDAGGRVVLTNRRFRDMYLLSEEQVLRGTPVKRLVQIFLERYALPDFSVEEFLTAIPDETSRLLQLSDGRIVHVRRVSTPDGGWLATHEDITEREQSARQIAHLAFHDPLTGLANRTKFNQKGEELLSQRTNDAALLMIDLDRFKSVNDSFGHAAGDRLLKLAASRMSAHVRADDLLARIGGDEFAILLAAQDNSREAAISLAARLIEVLAHPFELEGRQALVGASIGIALRTDKADSIEALLHQADLALYEVKASGRNASLIYDDVLGTRAHERLELETELREAIEAGELELHYQPIVALQSRQVCGMEGLVRWRHPVRGMLLPDRFIQLAEDSGLIVPLGEFVIRQACADASRWPDHVKVAVNISPTHIKRRTLLDTVAEALLQTGLKAERLEIEVTETVLMQQDEDILSELHQLRHLGVSIALDDFGTGYSSLSHLRMFSFDKVKIDRTFVAEITERPDSAAIVCAVTGLARALDMTTTVEGIETENQAQILLAAGCTHGQGYLFGRPEATVHLSRMILGPGNQKTMA
jgi:diguanylate cyclase (GGDEF)-like protein